MRKLIVAAVACVAVGVSGAAFARGGGGATAEALAAGAMPQQPVAGAEAVGTS